MPICRTHPDPWMRGDLVGILQVRRAFVASFAGLIVAATVFALPAGAQRLRSPASTLVLATPTVTCGSAPRLYLSWAHPAPAGTPPDRALSNTVRGEQEPGSARPHPRNAGAA